MNFRLVQKMLDSYKVVRAKNGFEGLAFALSETPDLILMDINLPDIDGLEVTRRLRADTRTQHLPIIALTANTLIRDRQEALNAGCDGYIPKPVGRGELIKTVQQFLNYIRPTSV
jgi:CheY-like chemotaxis protein